MPFPEFESSGRRVLFFSRGRGRGHVVPDMAIAEAVRRLDPSLEIRFVSYSAGAATLAAHGIPHVDLGLPPDNPVNETLVMAAKLIGWLQPDLVVAHEEFTALPAAKIFSKPTVFITDWFVDPGRYSMTCLPWADRILFLDSPGLYPEPPAAAGKVEYVGPLVRAFPRTRADRDAARAELGVPTGAFVVTVLPGSWTEAAAPIAPTVLPAWDRFPHPRRLFWMAGDDRDAVLALTGPRPDVDVRAYDSDIDRYLAATDAAITKGTRRSLFELAAIGIPSVSLTCISNPIDLQRASAFTGNEVLAAGADASELAAALHRARERRFEPSAPKGALEACARALVR